MVCLDEHYDAVVHLAGLVNVGDSMKWPMRYYQTNVGGTLNVMERVSYDNFIFASTGAAVGGAKGRSRKMRRGKSQRKMRHGRSNRRTRK